MIVGVLWGLLLLCCCRWSSWREGDSSVVLRFVDERVFVRSSRGNGGFN